MKKRNFLFQGLLVLVLVAIGAVMMVIGRGHTVYFDNRSLEYNGTNYDSLYKIEVYLGGSAEGEAVARLYDQERGMATQVGQSMTLTLVITPEDGGEEVGWLLLLQGLLLPLKGLLFLGCYAWLLFLRWFLLLKGLLLKALFFLGCYAWLGCRRVLIGLIGLTGLTGLIGLIGLGREKVNEGGETRVVVEGLLVGIQNAISITGRSNVIPNQCIANHLLA